MITAKQLAAFLRDELKADGWGDIDSETWRFYGPDDDGAIAYLAIMERVAARINNMDEVGDDAPDPDLLCDGCDNVGDDCTCPGGAVWKERNP